MAPNPSPVPAKDKDAAVVPAPTSGTVLPPAGPHNIVFRDRNDAEGVAKIYYQDCKTTDLKTGKEVSVADLAKKLEKDTNMANSRYNSEHKGAYLLNHSFDRAAYEKQWVKDHIGDTQLTHDGQTKSAKEFVSSVRSMVNGKSTVETPAMLEATFVHFKENRKVSESSMKEFYNKNIDRDDKGVESLKHTIKVDDERRGSLHAGILHLKGRVGEGLPNGSITLSTENAKWGADGEHAMVGQEIKSKKK